MQVDASRVRRSRKDIQDFSNKISEYSQLLDEAGLMDELSSLLKVIKEKPDDQYLIKDEAYKLMVNITKSNKFLDLVPAFFLVLDLMSGIDSIVDARLPFDLDQVMINCSGVGGVFHFFQGLSSLVSGDENIFKEIPEKLLNSFDQNMKKCYSSIFQVVTEIKA